MAAIAQGLPAAEGDILWLWQLLRKELTPYRGRIEVVARMLLAATAMMILTMTFQIPYGAYGVLYAFQLTRESLAASKRSALTVVVVCVIAGSYSVIGIMLALGDPMLRFLWVLATLFLAFYGLSVIRNYAAAIQFGYLTIITIPLLDSHISTELKVESTLWAIGAVSLGSGIALLVEIVYAAFRRADDLTAGVTDRLESVERLLDDYAENRAAEESAREVNRLAMVGTSRLRRLLQRRSYGREYVLHMSAVAGLSGRLVDIVSALPKIDIRFSEKDREWIRALVRNIAAIRTALAHGRVPPRAELTVEPQAGPALLHELQRTVALIPESFTGSASLTVYVPLPLEKGAGPLLSADKSLTNLDHFKFGLRGCLAAGLCYIAYNALAWPGISAAMISCFVSASSTIGASRQKQILRLAAASVGGLVFGIGSQIFLLPNVDSITGFMLVFVVAIGISAWVGTSSSRLSYLGLQTAFTFCLVNLQEFKLQTSLTIGRDRVLAVLLGLLAMWLAYDRLGSTRAGVEMKRSLVASIRLLARISRGPASTDLRASAELSYRLRDALNALFDRTRSLADGVLLEFGPSRREDLLLRDRIRRWQPSLRTLFLMRIAALKYRFQLPGFELPGDVRHALKEYDESSAQTLEGMAKKIEGPGRQPQGADPMTFESLERIAQAHTAKEPGQIHSFLTLLRAIDRLTVSLAGQVNAELG